jgi:chromate transporter
MVTALGWLYVRFGKLPATANLRYGIKPVVIAVILQALWGLGRTAIKSTFLGFVAVLSLVLSVFGLHPLLLLLVGGGVACLPRLKSSRLSLPALSSAAIGSANLPTATFQFQLAIPGFLEARSNRLR